MTKAGLTSLAFTLAVASGSATSAAGSAAGTSRHSRLGINQKTTKLSREVLNPAVKPGAIHMPGIKSPPKAEGRLLVVNKGPTVGEKGSSSIMVLDLAKGKVLRTIPTVPGPHEIAVSKDMLTAVAPNYGLQAQGAPLSAGGGHALTILDLRTDRAKTVSLPGYIRPHGVEWLDSNHVAVTVDGTRQNIAKGFVLVVNTKNDKIEQSIPTGQEGSHLVRLSPDQKQLYVSNIQSGSLSVIDRKTKRVIKIIPTGKGAEGFDISPDGKTIWVGNQDAQTITVIDTKTLEVARTIPSKGGPIRVQFAPDGKRALVVHRGSNDITFIDGTTGSELGRVKMISAIGADGPKLGEGSVPMMVSFHPTQPLAYVANSHSGVVSVLDMQAQRVAGYYKGGTKPDPLAWIPSPTTQIDKNIYPALAKKYSSLIGQYSGVYEGTARGKSYQLPRQVDPQRDGTSLAKAFPTLYHTGHKAAGSMKLDSFLQMIESTIPPKVQKEIDQTIAQAKQLGEQGMAAPFPYKDEAKIRHTLCYSWLHSRDMTTLMSSIGYPLESTGRHDIEEYAKGKYLKQLAATTPKDEWFKRYVATLKDNEPVNVGFMNPHWIADIWNWHPDKPMTQNAMDAHRLSDHHRGNPESTFDPIEAAVNNVFHRREEIFGVRHAETTKWMDIGRKLEAAEGQAAEFAASDVGVGIAKDAAAEMRTLEREGKVTPWYLAQSPN